METLKK